MLLASPLLHSQEDQGIGGFPQDRPLKFTSRPPELPATGYTTHDYMMVWSYSKGREGGTSEAQADHIVSLRAQVDNLQIEKANLQKIAGQSETYRALLFMVSVGLVVCFFWSLSKTRIHRKDCYKCMADCVKKSYEERNSGATPHILQSMGKAAGKK